MRRLTWIVAIVVLLYAAWASVYYALYSPLNHDEHMYVAAGTLIAREGLVLYRDMAYAHLPNLAYVYAALVWLSDAPFLAGRLLAGVSAFSVVALLFAVALRLRPPEHPGWRLALASGLAVLLTSSLLFDWTASHAWNHALSIFLALLAFVLLRGAVHRQMRWYLFAAAGLCLGLAAGVRVSVGPLAIPYGLSILLAGGVDRRGRVTSAGWFTAGLIVSLLPSLYFLVAHTQQLLANVWGHHQLDVVYRIETGHSTAITLSSKLTYYLRVILGSTGNLLIFLLGAFGLLGGRLRQLGSAVAEHYGLLLIMLAMPFVYAGVLVATPSWPQYFSATAPFLLLLAAFGLAHLHNGGSRRAGIQLTLLAALIAFVVMPVPKTPAQIGSVLAQETAPEQARRLAFEVREALPSGQRAGRVLTLAPIFAVESGLPVYPEFAAGPFYWRYAYLQSPEEREAMSLVGPEGLASLLQRDPPSAILSNTPHDGHLEGALVEAAEALGYEPSEMSNGMVVWVPTD